MVRKQSRLLKLFIGLWLFLICCSPVKAQQLAFQQQVSLLEDKLDFRKNKEVIVTVDSLLQEEGLTNRQRSILKSYKAEALGDSENYDESKRLANETLAMRELPDHYRVRLWIKQSLLHELIEDFKTGFFYLDKVDAYYATRKKDKHFGVSLYRRASLYRLSNKHELALVLADSARRFGHDNQFPDVIATANLLLGMMQKRSDLDIRLAHFSNAREEFTRSHDPEGVTSSLLLMADVYDEKDQPTKARKILFEALKNQKKPDTDSTLFGTIYNRLARLYEKEGLLDSALFFTRSANRISETVGLSKLHITIKQLEAEQEEMRRRFDVDRANADLEQSRTEKNFLAIGLSVAVFILLILGYLLYNLRRKNSEIKSQRKVIEGTNQGLKASLLEKDVLLKELNHRVKNNLSLILSLTSFHLEDIADPVIHAKVQDLENRIRSIAMTHDYFTYSNTEEKFATTDLKNYIERIIGSLIDATGRNIKYYLQIDDISVNMDTVLPIGILINELVSNTIKHAENNAGYITTKVRASLEANKLQLHYEDSGEVFKEAQKKDSLGLFIIESMVQQLDGSYQRQGSAYHFNLFLK